jgi:heme/copper-type cytochrome/quinol oxidase subunit 3
MIALPPAPRPHPRRQLLVGTALASAATMALIGGMAALWLRFRDDAIDATGSWQPDGVSVPEVASNVMLIAFLPIGVFAQWAVYSARRDDKQHTAVALGLVALLGLAVVNGQANIYIQMGVAIDDGAYGSMFYALTGTFMALLVAGIIFSLVTAFRYLGGRTTEREIVAAHAMFWYVLAAVYTAVWFVVYVTK